MAELRHRRKFELFDMQFKRVLIKISGELFSLNGSNNEPINQICTNILNVISSGIDVSIVVGGGNIIRGNRFQNNNSIRRETADSIGMLATVMNGIILRDNLLNRGVDCAIVSALDLPFNIRKLNSFVIEELISQHRTIIIVGGLGVPYFSTDTVSVVGATLSRCDAILKASNTDGIYDKDPHKHADAVFLEKITYEFAIQHNLQVMDETAFLLARNLNKPIYVFSSTEPNCFIRAINNEIKCSIVS